MNCALHTYDTDKRLVYALSGQPRTSRGVVVFVGGLGDGLMAVPYIEPLAQRLEQANWCFAQALLSSSYEGWKTGRIARDAREVETVVTHLRESGHSTIVLLGHSTGCQDIVEYARQRCLNVQGAILQAPVRPVWTRLGLTRSVIERLT